MQLFIDKKFYAIRILTNGVKYSNTIAEGLRLGLVDIMISIDAGSSDMYKWIKGFDVYEKVWNNIKKYVSVQKDIFAVKTKYIIIPGINDDKEEVLKFLDKSQESGIKSTAFDIELNWFRENENNIPGSLLNFIKFTVKETQNRGLIYEPIDKAVILLKEIKKQEDINISFRGNEI